MPTSAKSFDYAYHTFGEKPLEKALHDTRWFCADMRTNSKPYWLTLCGNSGTGKSHLARKVAAYFKVCCRGREYWPTPGHRCLTDYRFYRWATCMQMIYRGEWGSLDDAADSWLLIIDDIGAEHDPRKLGVAKLLEILERRRGMWTMLTTNLSMSEIERDLDVRIASRLIRDGSKVTELNATDFNLREPTNNENHDRTNSQGGAKPLH